MEISGTLCITQSTQNNEHFSMKNITSPNLEAKKACLRKYNPRTTKEVQGC